MQLHFYPMLLGLLSALCLAGCSKLSTHSPPSPQNSSVLKHFAIGTLPPAGSDAGYWFYQRNMPETGPSIFDFHDANHIHMNINGRIAHFKVLQAESTAQAWKFQSDDITVTLKPGPAEVHYSKMGTLIVSKITKYPRAIITVSEKGYQTLIIPIKGQTMEN